MEQASLSLVGVDVAVVEDLPRFAGANTNGIAQTANSIR